MGDESWGGQNEGSVEVLLPRFQVFFPEIKLTPITNLVCIYVAEVCRKIPSALVTTLCNDRPVYFSSSVQLSEGQPVSRPAVAFRWLKRHQGAGD